MTREEALTEWVMPAIRRTWNEKKCDEILKALAQEPCIQEKQANADKIDAVYIDGFKAGYSQARFDLEQESCDDCVSRKAAIDACLKGLNRKEMVSNIKALPPVTSAEKVAHWEYVQYDGNPNIGNWHCSKCRAIVNYKPTYNWEKKPYHKFCPNCGRKMEDVKE